MHSVRMLGLAVVAGLMSACGGGGSTQAEQHDPRQPPQDLSLGHLAVVSQDNDRAAISLYDLGQNKTVLHSALKQLPSGLYSSPNHGYAVMMDRVAGEVSFIQAGQTPKLLDYRLYGAAPTHYRNINGQAAVFYDGSDTQSAKFDVFTDQDIAQGSVATQHLAYKHHGVAEPRGKMVLSSDLAAGETQLSRVKSYAQHGNHYHEEQTMTQSCPGLHGAASNQHFIGFGCQDGVLLLEQQGQNFIDHKIATPVRIGTLLGHEKVNDLVALSSTQQDLFIVDPKTHQADAVAWAEAGVQRLKQSFSPSGQYFVILDHQGRLHILDTQNWQVVHRVQVFNPESTAIGQAQLAMHASQERLFMNDVAEQAIIELDVSTGTVLRRIALEVTPKQLAWVKAE